jgi:leader peptidase (prepilin peptidase)/N-methyltransferase
LILAISIFRKEAFPIFNPSFLRQYGLLLSFSNNLVVSHLAGAAIGSVFFGLLYYFSRGRAMGMGDVKLAFATGVLFGWPDTAFIISLSFILGGILGAFLIILGRARMKDKIPFGPIFASSAFLTMLFGYKILTFYFGFFHL